MRIFKTKHFARLARKGSLADRDLCEAVSRAEQGSVDAAIGKFLVKQRVAKAGGGRSGGFRAVVFYRKGTVAVFLDLFAKSRKANLTPREEEAFRRLAIEMASLSESEIRISVVEGEWFEVDYESYEKELSH